MPGLAFSEVEVSCVQIRFADRARTTKDVDLHTNETVERAVRLPADFRFEGEEVYITRDEASGDVVLSTHPGARAWGDFFELMQTIDVPPEFMADRPMNVPPSERNLFAQDGR